MKRCTGEKEGKNMEICNDILVPFLPSPAALLAESKIHSELRNVWKVNSGSKIRWTMNYLGILNLPEEAKSFKNLTILASHLKFFLSI